MYSDIVCTVAFFFFVFNQINFTKQSGCEHDYLASVGQSSPLHTVLCLFLPSDGMHFSASVRCGLQTVFACLALAHWVSGIGVNRLP